MGSRIYIKLVDLLSNPQVRVDLSAAVAPGNSVANACGIDHNAQVYFGDGRVEPVKSFGFTYDYDDSEVELSRDFNFYRGVKSHDDLMRALFDYGVSFTVHH